MAQRIRQFQLINGELFLEFSPWKMDGFLSVSCFNGELSARIVAGEKGCVDWVWDTDFHMLV